MLQPRPRIDRDEPPVTTVCGMKEDVGVQLRVWHLVGDGSGGGVPPARRDHTHRLGVQHRVRVDTLPEHRDVLDRVRERPVYRDLVRGLDLSAQLG